MLLELVATKGGHAGLDASCAQSDEDEAHHGERAEGEKSSSRSSSETRKTFSSHGLGLDWAYMWKVMLSGLPSMLVSVMSWMALTARTACPAV